MSYGVNTWVGQPGRARGAGSSKRKSTRTAKRKRSVSARRVRKKKTKRPPRKPRKAPRAARGSKRAKAPKAKKARLYTRYDPTTGQKVRVTSDTFEYRDWPSRKPSKKKIAREAFKSDPLGTTGSLAQQATKRAIERAGEQTVTRVLRSARVAVLPSAAAVARAGAGPVAAAAAILAAAYLVGDRIARDQRVKLGDRLNTISLRFKETQRQLIAAFGTRWEDVPADLRARAVRDYKSAIGTATSRAQGSAFAGVRAEGSYK